MIFKVHAYGEQTVVGWSKNLQVLGDACVHVRTYKYLVGQLIRAEIELS